ncbi:MAG TPA: mercuric transporter MerT family protein [Noviherbaspirillum sp.]|uniref:mercuric transporter MerT family protein n=1 Tax=Noviherbaspirillum sp. TaxID=1926288 RepID=UPI002B491C3C|nr:mercuric transporter MerT family protein [Noviherbaspirillum sp.]HJV84186.1 mercuric transporter MerT family protein [Noviherbaspirillum sp.]
MIPEPMLDNPTSIKAANARPRKNLSTGLMALAVGSSIIASTCCVLPLVLVLVGITGAWMVNLTSLRPITPFFTAISIGALVWAGVLVFRPSPACSTTEGPACDKARPVTKAIFLACAVFIGLLLLFPLFAPYFY